MTLIDAKLKRYKMTFESQLSQYWADFVDCNRRLRTECSFLTKTLNKYRNGTLLDAAMGTGCESIYLLKSGYNVISNEIDQGLIGVARQHAENENVILKISSVDWLNFSSYYENASIDCIILFGNSLCLLEERSIIENVLHQFYNTLVPGGLLLVDERNFDYILKCKTNILKGNFRYSGKYIYCGKSVIAKPIKISNNNVSFGYYHIDRGLVGQLDMYPFKYQELKSILEIVGFKTPQIFSDFKVGRNETADFFTYLAEKPK